MTDEKKKETLCDRIKKTRTIKEASCNTYMSALKKIRKKIITDKPLTGEIMDTDFLQDYDKVMKVINEEKKITSKKNKLTAILVALNADNPKNEELIDKYGNELKSLSEKYLTFLKTQKKTETQEKNWIEYNDLIKIINKVMRQVKEKEITQKKEELTNKEFDLLQQYLVLRTYIEFPLRNDFADMKVMDYNDFVKIPKTETEKNNYLVVYSDNKKEFHINQFKNKRYLGSKVLTIPPPLNRVINLWLKHNKSGYFLVKTDKKTPMSPNGITKFLNRIFLKYTGKKISTSMIRHIVISKTLRGEKTIKQKEEEAKKIEDKFFHSNAVNELYRKVD